MDNRCSEYDYDASNTLTHCEAENDPHPNDPWVQCPDDAGGVGYEVEWEDVYGQGYVDSSWEMLGSNDGQCGELDAATEGSVARVAISIDQFVNGLDVTLRIGSTTPCSLVYVYVEAMGGNWRFWGSLTIQQGNPCWLDFGYGDFDEYYYVLIAAYNDGSRSTVQIDSFVCGQ